jgi:hypothetical protein
MFFEKWMTKALGIVTALLAVFGFVKLSNKNAADARENEIAADNLQAVIDDVKEGKEIEKTINRFSDDSKRDRLRKFFSKTK